MMYFNEFIALSVFLCHESKVETSFQIILKIRVNIQ